jgi:TRAP-type uncharacterized transport system fused permease subunit
MPVAPPLFHLLYYLALFVQVDLEAGKTGIKRIPRKHALTDWSAKNCFHHPYDLSFTSCSSST